MSTVAPMLSEPTEITILSSVGFGDICKKFSVFSIRPMVEISEQFETPEQPLIVTSTA
jgi:hypothetical protein